MAVTSSGSSLRIMSMRWSFIGWRSQRTSASRRADVLAALGLLRTAHVCNRSCRMLRAREADGTKETVATGVAMLRDFFAANRRVSQALTPRHVHEANVFGAYR